MFRRPVLKSKLPYLKTGPTFEAETGRDGFRRMFKRRWVLSDLIAGVWREGQRRTDEPEI
jgi:hypothetical protein